MPRIIRVVTIDVCVAGEKIVAVHIVNIAVAVVVYSVAGNLSLVHPHVGFQVGMGVQHALVDDSHDNVGVAAAKGCPNVTDVHVSSGNDLRGEGGIAGILVIPLIIKVRVVELVTRTGGRNGLAGRIYNAVGAFGDDRFVFDQFNSL